MTQWIEPDELRRAIESQGAVTIVDVRGLLEFFSGLPGRLPEALNVPLPLLPACLEELWRRAPANIVVVSGTQMRSARAAAQLRAAGFRHVSVLRGGMENWRQLGYTCLGAPASRRNDEIPSGPERPALRH
jgi:rhodanese-related sulfurtransferase